MRPTVSRRWLTVLAVGLAFALGAGAGSLRPKEAQAQSLSASTVYVPAGGLVFRAPDGTALARLSRDAHGGKFELFDDRHEVSVRVPNVAPNAPPPPANPYAGEADPWAAPAARDDVF